MKVDREEGGREGKGERKEVEEDTKLQGMGLMGGGLKLVMDGWMLAAAAAGACHWAGSAPAHSFTGSLSRKL